MQDQDANSRMWRDSNDIGVGALLRGGDASFQLTGHFDWEAATSAFESLRGNVGSGVVEGP